MSQVRSLPALKCASLFQSEIGVRRGPKRVNLELLHACIINPFSLIYMEFEEGIIKLHKVDEQSKRISVCGEEPQYCPNRVKNVRRPLRWDYYGPASAAFLTNICSRRPLGS